MTLKISSITICARIEESSRHVYVHSIAFFQFKNTMWTGVIKTIRTHRINIVINLIRTININMNLSIVAIINRWSSIERINSIMRTGESSFAFIKRIANIIISILPNNLNCILLLEWYIVYNILTDGLNVINWQYSLNKLKGRYLDFHFYWS